LPTILSFLSGRQITNDSGVPQNGAKLYHYREGTTTALTVWTNDTATVAHPQPVPCDAGGFVPLIYVDDTFDWKVVITTSADVILKTYDNLPKAETDESAVGFAPPLLEWTQVTSAASPVALTVADVGKAYEGDTTGGGIEFDLPDAASVGNGKGFVFKKTAAANTLTVDPSASQTIDDVSTSFATTRKDEILGIFSNGAEWYKVFSHFGERVNVQAFTASGTYTPTTGMGQCIVISTGGGGGGGGADSDGSSADAGGGGGAGGTCIELFTAQQIGASQTVTIGAAGAAGANTGGDGGVGGDTTFGALHTAGGGGAGGGEASGNPINVADGGAGGTASGGLINVAGGGGGPGVAFVDSLTHVSGGVGGASFWGGGGHSITTQGSTPIPGIAGVAYGSGGSGAVVRDNTAGAIGGAGAAGICMVIEFI
jgi:hypothetical protein